MSEVLWQRKIVLPTGSAVSGCIWYCSPSAPGKRNPVKSGQLSGPISLFLFPELPGLPAADSAPLRFLLVGLHPSSLRSRSLAVTAGNVLAISPGLPSHAPTHLQRSPFLPGTSALFPVSSPGDSSPVESRNRRSPGVLAVHCFSSRL